jgi:hypothetical protein
MTETLTKNKYTLIISALSVLLIGWLSWYFSDKQVIKRQLIELSWNLSKKGKESTMETVLKMREVKLLLATENFVVIPERNYSESLPDDLIIRYLMYYRDRYENMTVTFEDILIDIPVKGAAEVSATVLLLRQKLRKEPAEIQASVELILKEQEEKGGNEWLLHKATVPEVLLTEE